jgi:protein farnesyltransferase subunit beta
MSHLATTYASVMALISIGTKEALDSINRKTLLQFLFSIKQSNGSFNVHIGGESDIRGVYCAAAVAVTCGIASEKLFENSVSWIMR